jgi:hypothetical protein
MIMTKHQVSRDEQQVEETLRDMIERDIRLSAPNNPEVAQNIATAHVLRFIDAHFGVEDLELLQLLDSQGVQLPQEGLDNARDWLTRHREAQDIDLVKRRSRTGHTYTGVAETFATRRAPDEPTVKHPIVDKLGIRTDEL